MPTYWLLGRENFPFKLRLSWAAEIAEKMDYWRD
jgi:hypothetical protein